MARLPQYTRQVSTRAVNPAQPVANNNTAQMLSDVASGIGSVAQIQSQMQTREARDYVIQSQNQTSVDLEQQKLNLSQTTQSGSEYTEGVTKFIEAQKASAVEKAPNQKAADATGQYYDSLMANELKQAIPVSARMNAENTARVINDSLEIGLNKTYRNPTSYDESLASANAVIDSSDLPENKKESAKSQYQEKLMTQQLLGTLNLNPKQAEKDIQSGRYDSLNPDTLNQISSSAKNQSIALDKQNEVNKQKQINKEKAEVAAQNAQATSNLEIGVSRGEMGYVEIEKAYDTGTITPEKRTQLTKQVDSQVDSMTAANNAIVGVSAAIDAGQPLDYRNKQHQQSVDIYYANMPEETRTDANAIANLVKSTKVIPSQVETQLNAGMKGNADQVVSSSDLLSRMNEMAPETVAQLPQDTKAVGLTVSRLVASGVDKAKAVELANNSVYNTPKELKEVLKTQLSEKNIVSKKTKGFGDAVDKISPSFFTPNRTPSMDRMEASFNFAVDQYYLKTHDIDTAMKLATTDISQVWGSTWVDGKERMMKYPPEKMYGNGKESTWIYNQLKSELSEIGVDAKSSLQADYITSRENRPSYIIMTEKDGSMMPLMVNGVIQRFTPDFSTTEEAKRAAEQKEQAMINAQKANSYVNYQSGSKL